MRQNNPMSELWTLYRSDRCTRADSLWTAHVSALLPLYIDQHIYCPPRHLRGTGAVVVAAVKSRGDLLCLKTKTETEINCVSANSIQCYSHFRKCRYRYRLRQVQHAPRWNWSCTIFPERDYVTTTLRSGLCYSETLVIVWNNRLRQTYYKNKVRWTWLRLLWPSSMELATISSSNNDWH